MTFAPREFLIVAIKWSPEKWILIACDGIIVGLPNCDVHLRRRPVLG